MTLNNTTKLVCTEDDAKFVLKFQLIVGGWSSTVTCILGLLANTFSIIILTNKRMRTLSTNIYLIALAIVNILWLISFLIFFALRLTIIVPTFIAENDENIYSAYNEMFHRLSPYIIPLMNTFQLCIIYYTVAVSVDRYLYISMGINRSDYCTVRNALRIILSLTIFTIIFIIPYWFKFRAVKRTDSENRTHYKISYSDLGQQKIFRDIVNIYIYIPVVHVIPLGTLIVINILTIRCLVKYNDEHRRLLCHSIQLMAMSKANIVHSRRHFHVSIMLIAVVLLFLLCRIPILINRMYEVRYSITDDYISPENRYFQCRIQDTFNTFVYFMQTINSNGNLIIYLLCCQNFRETSQELFEKLLNFLRSQSTKTLLSRIHLRSRTSTCSTEM